MTAIFKREFLSFFRNPVGYVVIALFSFISGVYFVNMLMNISVDISLEIISLRSFFIIIVLKRIIPDNKIWLITIVKNIKKEVNLYEKK